MRIHIANRLSMCWAGPKVHVNEFNLHMIYKYFWNLFVNLTNCLLYINNKLLRCPFCNSKFNVFIWYYEVFCGIIDPTPHFNENIGHSRLNYRPNKSRLYFSEDLFVLVDLRSLVQFFICTARFCIFILCLL